MIFTFEVSLEGGRTVILQILADDEDTALEYLKLQLEDL
jgi:hypothetical protein